MKIDFWPGHKAEEGAAADCYFYPNEGIYRGNIYNKDLEAIADFSGNSVEIQKYFIKKFNTDIFS